MSHFHCDFDANSLKKRALPLKNIVKGIKSRQINTHYRKSMILLKIKFSWEI